MRGSTVWQMATCALVAASLSLVAALALGKLLIHAFGRRWQERIVSDSPWLARLHQHKSATPTMGGLFVVAAIFIGLAPMPIWSGSTLPATMLVLAGLTALGAWDDLTKLRLGQGLQAKQKLAAQCLLAAGAMSLLYAQPAHAVMGERWLPGLGGVHLGFGIVPLGMLVIVGSSNAVNLTDGLDGLAGGCLVIAFGALGGVAFLAGNANLAQICGVTYVPEAAVVAIACVAAAGAVIGFLYFNRQPARVFLGDAGSLPLGGLLGLLAILVRQELLLLVIGGVFVAEALSVMLQVGYFKWRRRRILLCAPLHHHFQFLGWAERQIVRRFWLAAALSAVVGLGGWSLASFCAERSVTGEASELPARAVSYIVTGADFR